MSVSLSLSLSLLAWWYWIVDQRICHRIWLVGWRHVSRFESDRMFEIDLGNISTVDEIRPRVIKEFGASFTKLTYTSLMGEERPVGDIAIVDFASQAMYCIAYAE
jgi:hypothetical protein